METDKSIDTHITEYNFLFLLSSVMVIQGCSLVIDIHELEQKLSLLCDSPKYQDLFKCFFDGNNIPRESASIDLTPSFLVIYNYGILTPSGKEGELKSTINMSREAAWNNINRFNIDTVDKMNDLSREINSKIEKVDTGSAYVKKASCHN